MSSENHEEIGYGHDLRLITFFISYEKWVQRENVSI
jgi:hypothetical protein